ncbi:EamA family transporter [Klebsiella michiganensis]|uniref:EamA family transporter n=1 Tax=Klebsiella michiganensis TaxID=1134687 RepID=UPI0032DBBCA0
MPLLLGVLANIIWGLTPVYFYFFRSYDAYNVIFMQVTSTLIVLLLLRGRRFSLKLISSHIFTAGLLFINWLSYFLAIQSGRAIEASLGYLLLPFLTILCGVFLLRESITRNTIISLFISLIGVLFLIYTNKQIPFFGIIIAASFATYITIHKLMNNHDPFTSLLHELLIIMPLFLVFSYFYNDRLEINLSDNLALLPLGVIVTSPLILYLTAIKSLTLLKSGIIQLISPIIIVIVSVLLFKEPMEIKSLVSYMVIIAGFLSISLCKKDIN